MAALFMSLLGAMRSAFRTRAELALENLALRQQLANLRLTSVYPKWVACITATSAARPDRDKWPPCRRRDMDGHSSARTTKPPLPRRDYAPDMGALARDHALGLADPPRILLPSAPG